MEGVLLVDHQYNPRTIVAFDRYFYQPTQHRHFRPMTMNRNDHHSFLFIPSLITNHYSSPTTHHKTNSNFIISKNNGVYCSSMLERILTTRITLLPSLVPFLELSTFAPWRNNTESLSFSTRITAPRRFFLGLMVLYLLPSVTTKNTVSPSSLLT